MTENISFKAVLFDLDGTLLDTAEDLGDAMNAVLSRHNYPTHDPETIRSFIGRGIKEFVSGALPEGQRNDEIVASCYEEMQQEYSKRWKIHTKPYPQIPELLTALGEKHIPFAVLSNKEDAFAKEMVATLLSSWTFARVVGSTIDSKPKPNPDSAIRIAQELGLIPTNFLYVGDSDIDMQTAKISGMYALWAKWGYAKSITFSALPLEHPLDILTFL